MIKSQSQVTVKLETLLKKRLWDRCFPVNFAKFLRTSFLQNTSLAAASVLQNKAQKLMTSILDKINTLVSIKQVIQKQPPEVFYEKSYSKKFRKIHRKTLVPESPFFMAPISLWLKLNIYLPFEGIAIILKQPPSSIPENSYKHSRIIPKPPSKKWESVSHRSFSSLQHLL